MGGVRWFRSKTVETLLSPEGRTSAPRTEIFTGIKLTPSAKSSERGPDRGDKLHLPVLKEEVLDFLDPEPGDILVDATLGGGGHSSEILKRIMPGGRLIAMDRDHEAIRRARLAFKDSEKGVTLVREDFRNIKRVLSGEGVEKIDGVIFDLGMSSYQLDDNSRGFSFMKDGPLDMRFDTSSGITAMDVVNSFTRNELAEIIREYGEEKHNNLIARAIVEARKRGYIRTTGQLAEIVSGAAGRWYSRQKIHPACRTFQAIRMYVNAEMSAVEHGVEGALGALRSGKRICVISFHSLEDRVVKNIFRREKKLGHVKIVTKKPVLPSRQEVYGNPRSRSAKLRVAERV